MTVRDRLVQTAASRVSVNNLKVKLQENGQTFTMQFHDETIVVRYKKIEPGSVAMNEVIEDTAQMLGEKFLNYYLKLSDVGYRRLESEIYGRS